MTKVCCVIECDAPVFKIVSITKAIFSGRKQGIFIVKYPLCEHHEKTRDGIVDQKKFKKVNPHVC